MKSPNTRGLLPGDSTEGKIIHFGKYKGVFWSDVPLPYLQYLARQRHINVRVKKALYEINLRKTNHDY